MALGKKTGGRKKGVPNKINGDTKAIIAAFVAAKAGRVDELWESVAQYDEKGALALWANLAEFVAPKLARSEVTGKDGEPMRVSIVINGIDREQEREGMESTADAGSLSRF